MAWELKSGRCVSATTSSCRTQRIRSVSRNQSGGAQLLKIWMRRAQGRKATDRREYFSSPSVCSKRSGSIRPMSL